MSYLAQHDDGQIYDTTKRLDLPLIQPFLYKIFCRLYLPAQPAFYWDFFYSPFHYFLFSSGIKSSVILSTEVVNLEYLTPAASSIRLEARFIMVSAYLSDR